MRSVPLIEAVTERDFGGKAVQLGAAIRAGLPVPPGFAIDAELVDALARGAGESRETVARTFALVGGMAAVRSSAVGEDSGGSSFAGQHLTVLNVRSAAEALDAVAEVHRSGWAASARAYRQRRGLDDAPRMGVVLQRLIEPDTAGVLFTRNPLDGSDERVVEAAWGLGEAVVSGLVGPDAYRIARDGRILDVQVGEKHVALRPLPAGGTREEPLDAARSGARCLEDRDLLRLHELASRCEEVHGRDLDIEWAIAAGRVHLLQVRPITVLGTRAVA
jgi:pyruvate,water dikinase